MKRIKEKNVEFNLGTTISNECANLVKTLTAKEFLQKTVTQGKEVLRVCDVEVKNNFLTFKVQYE